MSASIQLTIKLTREEDGTFSLSAVNPDADGDAQFVDGLSEVSTEDETEKANEAGAVAKYFFIDNAWRLDPAKRDLAAATPWGNEEPLQFKRSNR